MADLIKTFQKEKFLELISSGQTEPEALKELNFPKAIYLLLLVKDIEYREMVDKAKKERADVWFQEIINSTKDKTLSKEDVPVEKLKFEQRKYLAAIDNPDKYAEKTKHSLDLNVNIFQEMKDLPISEARELLKSVDPFNLPPDSPSKTDDQNVVEAEFSDVLPHLTKKERRERKLEYERQRWARDDEDKEFDTTTPMELEEEEDIYS